MLINEITSIPHLLKAKWDHVIVNTSGGKDSSVLTHWAKNHFPVELLTMVHAIIDIDWEVTVPIVEAQAKFFNLPLVKVQSVDSEGNPRGFIDKLLSPRRNRITGELGEQMFPSNNSRWCTSDLKVAPISKYIRTLKGNILSLTGERRQESSNRAKLDYVRFKEDQSVNGRTVVQASPLLDVLEDEIWETIHKNNIPFHPCYSWGCSRASCAICIFSKDIEIKIAEERAPVIVEKYLDAESKISHTFRYKAATKTRPAITETVREILARTKLESPEARLRKMLERQWGGDLKKVNAYLSKFKPEQLGGLYERLIQANCDCSAS